MIATTGVLQRERAALVVIDIQERLAAAMPNRERVIARTRLLIATASIVGVPVIATRQYPRGLGELEPDVMIALEESDSKGNAPARVDKVAFDCFAEPEFSSALVAAGRTQLLIAGMETHICVCQTALAGLKQGLDIHVAADACCSRDDANHDLAIMRLAHAGAVVTTAESAAYELVGKAGTDEFKALLGAVKAC